MDAKKLAKDMLSKGKTSSDVRYALVEKGLAFSEADRIVKELTGNNNKIYKKNSKSANFTKSYRIDIRKIYPIVAVMITLLVVILVLSYFNINGSHTNIETTTTVEITTTVPIITTTTYIDYFYFENVSEKNLGIFNVSSKNKVSQNGLNEINFIIQRDEIPKNIFIDFIKIYVNLENSKIEDIQGVSYFDSYGNIYIMNVSDSKEVSFKISGIPKVGINMTMGGKPLPFGDYDVVITEQQNTHEYGIFW